MTQENTGIATNEKNIMISNAIREIAWKYFIETGIDKKPIFHYHQNDSLLSEKTWAS